VKSLILLGFIGSLAAGLATGVGALPVLFVKRPSKRYLDLMLGFAAGVMLSASSSQRSTREGSGPPSAGSSSGRQASI